MTMVLCAAGYTPLARAQDFNQAYDICRNAQLAPDVRVANCSMILQGMRLAPNSQAGIHHNRGLAYFDMGDTARAMADYDQALRLDPQLAESYNGRARIYHRQGDYVRAMADYDQAIRLAPRSEISHFNRGLAHFDQAQYTLALPDFDQAIQLAPRFAQALYWRGVTYSRLNNFPRAWGDQDIAGEIEPNYAEAHNGRCWNRARARMQFDVARQACDRAVHLAADATERGYYNETRGFLSLHQGRWQEAWNDYDSAVRATPNFARYLYGRGIAALRLGRSAESAADIAAATALDAGVAAHFASQGISP